MKISENEKYILRVLINNYEKLTSISCTQLVNENYISRTSFYVFLNKIGFTSYYAFQNSIRFKSEKKNSYVLLEKLVMLCDIYIDYDSAENVPGWINEHYIELYNIYCDVEEYDDTEIGKYLEADLLRVLYNMTFILEGKSIKNLQMYKVVDWLF